MKNKRYCLIAPTFVMTILLSIYLYFGIFPFGSKTISWCDMNQQVIPFLMDFKDILSGNANMFLNMQNGGGMSFWGIFLFFISSPFTFLVAFVDKSNMYFFVNILVVLKMMLCSFTASVYFKYKFRNLNILQNVAISVMYAFCGYSMFYYQNHVWLDIMYLFPILLIGLMKLIDERKITLYIVAFSAVLTVNFYLSYMVCIFIVLSFGIYSFFFSPREKRYKNILLLGISTLLVALITAVVWLPSLMQYLQSARTGNIIASLKIGRFFSRFDTTLAVIICTSAIFSAIFTYLIFIKKQSKMSFFTFVIFLLTFIPVIIEPINKMWHTGNYQAFPVRYGYITIFFGLILFAYVISSINNENHIQSSNLVSIFVAMLCVSSVFIAECLILNLNYEKITVYTKTLWGNNQSFQLLLIFSAITALSYFTLILLHKYNQLSKTAFSIMLCLVVLIESIFNSSVYIASASHNLKNELPVIDLSNKIKDETLYRVKTKQKYFDVNLIGSLGYNTLNHYTSLTNEDFMYTMKKLGYSSYWMEVNSNGGTKFTDAVLGNKYSIIHTNQAVNSDDIIYKNKKFSIKKNEFSIPLGFVMYTDKIDDLKYISEKNRFDIQQSIFESVFNTNEELLVKYKPNLFNNINYTVGNRYKLAFTDNRFSGILTYSIPIIEKQTLYFDCFDKLSNNLIEQINSSFSVYVNGKSIQTDYPNQMNNGILNLGTFKNEVVNVEIRVLKEVNVNSFGISGLKEEILQNSINKLKPLQLKQSENKIIGSTFSNGKNKYLFLPITYNNGYTAKINNKKCEIISVFDSMMAIKLENGINNICISYCPCGFKIGAIMSMAGVFFTIGLLFIIKKSEGFYKRIKFLEIPAAIIFSVVFIAIFAAIYIFPIIIYFTK